MRFCNDSGIAHSQFLEWEVTDRAKALAQLLEAGDRCHLCGTAQWEWDPKRGGNKFAYEPVAVMCPGCYAKEAASDDTSRLPGVTIELHPTGTKESAKRFVAQQRADAARRARLKHR